MFDVGFGGSILGQGPCSLDLEFLLYSRLAAQAADASQNPLLCRRGTELVEISPRTLLSEVLRLIGARWNAGSEVLRNAMERGRLRVEQRLPCGQGDRKT